MFISEQYFNRSNESLQGIASDELLGFIEPKLEPGTSMEGLSGRLLDQEQLRIKIGIDPTGPDIHLGHVVPVRPSE